jgi:hypothetical protein
MKAQDQLEIKPENGNSSKPLLAVVLGNFRKMFKIFTKISCLKIN